MILLNKIEMKTTRTKIAFGLIVKVERPDNIANISDTIIVFMINVLSKLSRIK